MKTINQIITTVIVFTFLFVGGAKAQKEKSFVFPMEKSKMKRISVSFGKEMINPITKKQVVHKGIDIVAPKGTSVVASFSGEIIKADKNKSYGNYIKLKNQEGYIALYAHLDEMHVSEGSKVEKGELIGTVGNTGYSTGPHLHFEIRKGKKRLDPELFF